MIFQGTHSSNILMLKLNHDAPLKWGGAYPSCVLNESEMMITGVGKCPNVSHHPTIGDTISNRYLKVMFKIPNYRDIYQPLIKPEISQGFLHVSPPLPATATHLQRHAQAAQWRKLLQPALGAGGTTEQRGDLVSAGSSPWVTVRPW